MMTILRMLTQAQPEIKNRAHNMVHLQLMEYEASEEFASTIMNATGAYYLSYPSSLISQPTMRVHFWNFNNSMTDIK